jgi:hypothetical protein
LGAENTVTSCRSAKNSVQTTAYHHQRNHPIAAHHHQHHHAGRARTVSVLDDLMSTADEIKVVPGEKLANLHNEMTV